MRIYDKFVHLGISQLLDAFYFQYKNTISRVSLLQKVPLHLHANYCIFLVFEDVTFTNYHIKVFMPRGFIGFSF